jgi:signal transduction histidine kinase
VARLEDLAGVEPVARYTAADGLAEDDIWHLYEDARGDVWIATRIPGKESLTRWERGSGRFHRYGTDEGLPAARAAWGFAENDSGTLWISFWDGGLARYDGHAFQYFATGPALPPGPRYQIVFDDNGWLWVSGRQLLYSRNPGADDPQFETFRTADGRPVEAIALAGDAGGWIYAGTPAGILRFRPEEDGVQQLGTGGIFTDQVAALFRDVDSTLWAIRPDGVLRYEPRYERESRSPSAWIGAVRVGGVAQPVPAMGATRLAAVTAATDRQVRIDYFGLAFGTDQPLRFQVRLEGVDENWSDPTTARSVLYAGLGPGHYAFQVRAIGPAGQISAVPATVPFTVPPPVWRRGWFLALFAAMFASLLVGAHRLRLRRLLALERIRTRIAADLHDDLGASLARVSLLTEAIRRTMRDHPGAAERMLSEIGETSRSLVSAAGDIAFSIDPGRVNLEALVARVRRFAEELLAGIDAEWLIKVEGETATVILSSDQRRHLLAILKEALYNAVRHGRPRRLAMTLSVRSDVLEVDLVDDGRGFAPDTADRPDMATGNGLRNMRKRAGELHGQLVVDSSPGAGTRVRLVVPLHRVPRMSMQ